jgi:hypothetical protein
MTGKPTLDDIPERVTRGVALLDEKQPGWEALINLGHLDIGECENCVLGQVYRDQGPGSLTPFEAGAIDLIGEYEYGFWNNAPALVLHGFSAGAGEDVTFDVLTAEWKRVIQERRTAAEIPSGGES